MRPSVLTTLTLLFLAAALVPALALVAGSQYLNLRARQQLASQTEETLNLSAGLLQSLTDSRMAGLRDQAAALAQTSPVIDAPLSPAVPVTPALNRVRRAIPTLDTVVVTDAAGKVIGRAGTGAAGDAPRYGGLLSRAVATGTPVAGIVRLEPDELAPEAPDLLNKAQIEVQHTEGAGDGRTGKPLGAALALVGVAPVRGPNGSVTGAVATVDLLNNDPTLVDEVVGRSPRGLPLDATLALDDVRVATSVHSPGGGRRAVGTLFSDVVMQELRQGRQYRGRALVGGWQWQQTTYLPLTDPAGHVIGAAFVGVPEENFTALIRWTSGSTWVALGVAVLSLAGVAASSLRVVRRGIVRPLERFATLLDRGDLSTQVDGGDIAEVERLAQALNAMTARVRRTVGEIAAVSHGVRAVSDQLAAQAGQTAADADGALQVTADAAAAGEAVADGAYRAAERARGVGETLRLIEAQTAEQARAIRHAGLVIGAVSAAVRDSRGMLGDVLEATRETTAAVQRGRHSSLRTLAALDLAELAAGGAEAGTAAGRAAADECDAALQETARSVDAAVQRLWDLTAVLNESGARVGAVATQVADLSEVAEETTAAIRATGEAARAMLGEVDSMAGGTAAARRLVQQARTHVTAISRSNRTLSELSDRIRRLAHELDAAAGRFPQD